jgi:Carbohydrate-binding family 9
MEYGIRAAVTPPPLEAGWEDAAWQSASTLEIAHFRPEGSEHRPRTRARLLRGPEGLHGLFRVEDRYVRSVHSRFQDPVHEDSCVELFLEPPGGHGYLNFEFNCGGTLLASHVTDPRRVPGGFAAFRQLPEEDGRRVLVRGSLPRVVDPEITEPVSWQLGFFVPTALLEEYTGPIGPLGGQVWRGNLYKCGDKTSHPHWAAWSPVDELNFHLPRCFGTLRFL